MTNTTLTAEQKTEIVAAAAVCARTGYDVSRRLKNALRGTEIADRAEEARTSGLSAGPPPVGNARPAPKNAVETVWCWLDRNFGIEITRAMY